MKKSKFSHIKSHTNFKHDAQSVGITVKILHSHSEPEIERRKT